MIQRSFVSNSFQLKEDFLEQFKGKQPDWGPLGYFVYKRTYARYIESRDRKEEYWETIRRVVEGCFSIQKEHCKILKIPWDEAKARKLARKMYIRIWEFQFTPPGRGFWIMGTDFIAEHGSMALNNCGFVSTKDINIKFTEAFEFLMYSLMVGVGVGFDTKGAGKIKVRPPKNGIFKFKISDSREGWVKALKLLLEAYMNLIGTCVIAGGVRRSAQIALGNQNDREFIRAKQNKKELESHRWVSNNSIIAKKGMDYSFIADQVAKNGEPGIFWLENARNYSRMGDPPDFKDENALGTNPCGEQTLESFELCCLAETYPSRHKNWSDFKETLKCAYIYAKTVTLLNTNVEVTNAVMVKNRRMGISQTGIIEAFERHGKTKMLEWCRKGYQYLKELDGRYSNWLCVPRSIKLTTVKPSGTVSLLAGVSHGIHFPHAKYYIRRIRINNKSELVDIVKTAGYKVERDKYSENTLVIEFPIKKKHFNRGKNDVTIWEQAENAALYQKYWSDNQVSVTITFKEEEQIDIKHLLETYEDKLKCISFLPLKEHGYEQAPYEEITKEVYKKMKKHLKPLYLEKVKEKAWGQLFCDSEECEIHLKR
ncbi:MAG: hypothetical protein P8Y97_05495 [Candidatus Lokiarchaeota archaeon]